MRNRTTAAAGGLVLLGSLAVSGAVPAQAVSGGDYVPSVARATHVFPAFAGGMRSIDRGVSQIIPAGHRCVDEMATTPNQRSAWTGSYASRRPRARSCCRRLRSGVMPRQRKRRQRFG